MDALRFDDSSPETLTRSRLYIAVLNTRRGRLTVEECRGLFGELNDFLMPFRDGKCEPEEGTFVLLLMLNGNTNSKGPLDSIKAFVTEFGSVEAKQAYEAYKPHEAFAALIPTPIEKPVTPETLRAYMKDLLKSWLGLISP